MSMDGAGFSVDPFWSIVAFVLACVVSGVAWIWLRRRRLAAYAYSQLSQLQGGKPSWRVRLVALPVVLKVASLALLLVALANPTVWLHRPLPLSDWPEREPFQELVSTPNEGIALYFVLDRSGSMKQEVGLRDRKTGRQLSRIAWLKRLTADFICGNERLHLAGRPNDLIGLVGFARVAEVIAPLTLDHAALLESLHDLRVAQFRHEDGTAIGYALFKTVNLVAATRYFAQEVAGEQAPYEMKSAAIVLVTDGVHTPNPLDWNHPLRAMEVSQAAIYAEEHDVRVYIVNVEPMMRQPRFAEYREELERLAERTGGRFFIADDPQALATIYGEIDRLERAALPGEWQSEAEIIEQIKPDNDRRPVSLVPICLGIGAALLVSSLALSATILRRGV